MEDQARAIGQHLRYWRLRRNLNRQRFADRVGRSTSWLDKVEAGERSLLRLPMLDKVAAVLDIDVRVLTDSAAARRAADCIDTVEVKAVKAALGCYPIFHTPNTDDQALSRMRIENQLAYIEHAWSRSSFTVAARYLPRLLPDAQSFALTASAADQVAAYRMLVITYRLAASVLMKLTRRCHAGPGDA